MITVQRNGSSRLKQPVCRIHRSTGRGPAVAFPSIRRCSATKESADSRCHANQRCRGPLLCKRPKINVGRTLSAIRGVPLSVSTDTVSTASNRRTPQKKKEKKRKEDKGEKVNCLLVAGEKIDGLTEWGQLKAAEVVTAHTFIRLPRTVETHWQVRTRASAY